MTGYRLYAAEGGGSMLTEIALHLAGVPFEVIEVDWADTGWDSKVLKAINPLGQVPTLVLPDGSVMTESSAIFLHVAEQFPATHLAPRPGDPLRPKFLRWLAFFVSAIYPTFTYGDVTERWVGESEQTGAGKALRVATDDHRRMLWRFVEGQIQPDPWVLGRARSALDYYLWVMTHWRPGRDWFESQCPGLFRVALALDTDPVVLKVKARNKL